MTVSENHMEAARRIANDRFILTSAYDVDRDQLAEEISAALDAAERNGRDDERKAAKEHWLTWHAKRADATHRIWMRAAKSALNGDLRELRNRVELFDAEPLEIVLSEAGEA